MKKRIVFYIIFASLLSFLFRMNQLSGVLSEKVSVQSFYITLILIILPSLYGAVSYFLIGRLPKALLMNGAALIIAAAAVTFCTQCPPLSEGVVIILQVPALLTAYFAAKLIHTSKSRKYKLLVSILFCLILAGIAGIMYSVNKILLLFFRD